MKRQAAVLSAALAAIGLGIAGASSTAQQPSPPTGTLELRQRVGDVTFRPIDVRPFQGPRQRPNPGDGAVISGGVRNEAGRRVGRLQAVFVVVNVRRQQFQVSATFVLRGGRIMASGADTRARVEDFAVTGGTGRFAGARGTVRVTERRRTTTFLFTFFG